MRSLFRRHALLFAARMLFRGSELQLRHTVLVLNGLQPLSILRSPQSAGSLASIKPLNLPLFMTLAPSANHSFPILSPPSIRSPFATPPAVLPFLPPLFH